MKAAKGDWLIVESTHVGEHRRRGLIIDVRGDSGAPPFLVRWTDDHEALIFPGPDARVEAAADEV